MISGILAIVVTDDEDTSMSVVANRFLLTRVVRADFSDCSVAFLSNVSVNFMRKPVLGFQKKHTEPLSCKRKGKPKN